MVGRDERVSLCGLLCQATTSMLEKLNRSELGLPQGG